MVGPRNHGGRLRNTELGAEVHSLGKGPRCTKAGWQLQGQLEEEVTLPDQDQSSRLRRKGARCEQPGEHQGRQRAQSSASDLQGCFLKRSFLERTLRPQI